MKSKLGIIIVAILVLGTIGYALVSGSDDDTNPSVATPTAQTSDNNTPEPQSSPAQTNSSDVVASGRYTDFTSDRQMEEGYDTTVLFFYASWCPECRGFDQAIQQSTIPDGTQILRVNYDESQDLRQQYGVTIQTTFVSVTSDGSLVKKWVGYNEQKSLDAVLQNVSG